MHRTRACTRHCTTINSFIQSWTGGATARNECCWLNTQLKTTGIQRIMLLFSTSAFNGSTTQQQHRSFVLYCVDEDSWKENGWQNDHERTEFEGRKKSLFNSRSLWLWMTATRNRQLQCKTSPIHRKRVCSLLLRLPTTRTTHDAIWKPSLIWLQDAHRIIGSAAAGQRRTE